MAPRSKRWDFDLCVRDSLDKDVFGDKQLTEWACSSDPADLDATQLCLSEMANASPPIPSPLVADWDHVNAQKWLWETSADSGSFRFDKRQLIIAATYITAELEVSRKLSYMCIQPHIFKLVTMANSQVIGYWGGALARFGQLRV